MGVLTQQQVVGGCFHGMAPQHPLVVIDVQGASRVSRADASLSPVLPSVCSVFSHGRFKQAWGRVDGANWQRATSSQS